MTPEDFLYRFNKMLVPLLEEKLKNVKQKSFEDFANAALKKAQEEVLPKSIDAMLRDLFPEDDSDPDA